MNFEGTIQTPPTADSKISLYNLVSKLITSLQPLAVQRNNILLNDIPKDLSMTADQNTIAYVLCQLVNSAVNSTENQCIHIEAVLNNEHRMLRVKSLHTQVYHTLEIISVSP
jgi:signal transduction histidine kinase